MGTVLERARAEGTPLIDGDAVTFVWAGGSAPELRGDFVRLLGEGRGIVLEEQEPGVWTRTVHIPSDAYLEYYFHTDAESLVDPFNDRVITDGLGGMHNYFYMPQAPAMPLLQEQPGVPRGLVSDHLLENQYRVVGETRAVHLYAPPAPGPWPLLVVFDGQDYLTRAHLPTIVDNLIAAGRVKPFAMALAEHGDSARFVEYNCNESTLDFVLRDVFPLARAHLDLLPEDTDGAPHGVLGASMGGLMALYTALRVPNVFGRVVSQSGAFLFEYAGNPSVVFDLARCNPAPPLEIWLDVGIYERLLPSNQRMRDCLLEQGYDVTYREFPGGHNYTSWTRDVVSGLEAIFGVDAEGGA